MARSERDDQRALLAVDELWILVERPRENARSHGRAAHEPARRPNSWSSIHPREARGPFDPAAVGGTLMGTVDRGVHTAHPVQVAHGVSLGDRRPGVLS